MNQGKFVYSQLTDFLHKRVFDCIVDKYNGNKHIRFLLVGINNAVCSLVNSGRKSIRALMIDLYAHKSKFYHLGFGRNVTRSNLTKANEKHSYKRFKEFAYHLINEARKISAFKGFDFNIKSNVYAFDSSIVDS